MISNVLIIDDDLDICKLLKKCLEAEGMNVTTVNDGLTGEQQALQHDWHLIVLDIMLPGKTGFEVLNEIRKQSTVPVLMLTAKDSEIDKVSGLRLGADDYLTKPFSINEFTARAQSLIRRYTRFNVATGGTDKYALHFQGLSIDPQTREVICAGKNVELTPKEFDLLFFLASNKDKVFTKKQIYHAVWDDEYVFDDNNIMVHIRRLRKKIESDPEEAVFIQTVWGVGYKFCGQSLP